MLGIMDGAYFVGRKELLEFFNELLDINLSKIEQTASGAVACQVTELIFPNSIPMSRVNWEARSDYEFVQNYKLLQAAFTKHRVQRHVDVDKLIRAKYQDNLEFCQWLKAFYDQAGTGGMRPDDYDPAAVRAKGKGGKKFNQQQGSGGARSRGGATRAGAGGITKSRVTPTSSRSPVPSSASPLRSHNYNHHSASKSNGTALVQENTQLQEKVSYLESALEEVERDRDQIVMDVEKERDFYFGKLRSIEVMLQVHQEDQDQTGDDSQQLDENGEPKERPTTEETLNHLVERVFQILYATAEDNLTVNSRGQVVDAATLEEEEEGEIDPIHQPIAEHPSGDGDSLLAEALDEE